MCYMTVLRQREILFNKTAIYQLHLDYCFVELVGS